MTCLTGREVVHLTHIIDKADVWGINYLQEVILAIYLYPPNPLYLFPAKIIAFTVMCWPVNLYFYIQGDVRA